MPKNKGKKRQASAREIQTPVSDRANTRDPSSDSESRNAESSKDPVERQKLQEKFGRSPDRLSAHPEGTSAGSGPSPNGSPEQTEDKQTRFARDPFHKEDFAPGEVDSDFDMNDATDPELENASEQEGPTEHVLPRPSTWVKKLIKSETTKYTNIAEEFFNSETPDYDKVEQFFRKLNQQIRGLNEQHHANDIDTGIIPESTYVKLCQVYRQQILQAMEQGDKDRAWQAWQSTYNLLKEFNKRHYLPRTWNLRSDVAETKIGSPNPQAVDSGSDRQSVTTNNDEQADLAEIDDASQIVESDDESPGMNGDQGTGLDALEARTVQHHRGLSSGKVLYWWSKGTGSQIFVRYGDRSTPVYRIRAGSHESYSPHQVERVLTSTRGTAKAKIEKNGIPEEIWKYGREHVEDIIGVGWKVEDDDESDLNPLSLIRPGKGTLYPQTRVLVKWKDRKFTLEGRAFIRRITSGSSLDGDRVLYQKACEMESTYRLKHGLAEIVDDESDDGSIEDYQPRRGTRSHTRFEDSSDDSDDSFVPRRKIKQGKRPSFHQLPLGRRSRTTNTMSYESASDSDEAFMRRRMVKQGKRPARPSPPIKQREDKPRMRSKTENERIRKLEEELHRLKLGRTRSQGQTRAETNPPPKYRTSPKASAGRYRSV